MEVCAENRECVESCKTGDLYMLQQLCQGKTDEKNCDENFRWQLLQTAHEHSQYAIIEWILETTDHYVRQQWSLCYKAEINYIAGLALLRQPNHGFAFAQFFLDSFQLTAGEIYAMSHCVNQACSSNNLPMLQWLLSDTIVDISSLYLPSPDNTCCLDAVCRNGELDMLQFLVARFDINIDILSRTK